MKLRERGFSVVEAVIAIIVVGLLALGGYVLMQRNDTPADKTSTVESGTPEAVEEITAEETDGESSLDEQDASAEEADLEAADEASADLEGAYDETTL